MPSRPQMSHLHSAYRSSRRAGSGQPKERKQVISAEPKKTTTSTSGPTGKGGRNGACSPSSQRRTVRPVRNSCATRHRTAGRSPSGAENSVSQHQISWKGSDTTASILQAQALEDGVLQRVDREALEGQLQPVAVRQVGPRSEE